MVIVDVSVMKMVADVVSCVVSVVVVETDVVRSIVVGVSVVTVTVSVVLNSLASGLGRSHMRRSDLLKRHGQDGAADVGDRGGDRVCIPAKLAPSVARTSIECHPHDDTVV